MSSLAAAAAVGVKHASRSSSQLAVRLASLRLTAAAVKALGPDIRSATSVQGEALKLVDRNSKVILKEVS